MVSRQIPFCIRPWQWSIESGQIGPPPWPTQLMCARPGDEREQTDADCTDIYDELWCLCLRQENRTCVLLLFCVLLFVLGLGWGGVGGHVNVPCTSCIIYCHVAKISCYVTCCYAAEISSVGWGWGGVGWGGMLTFLVLRALYIAMLLRSLGSCATLHVATLLRSLGLSYYVTCWYAAEISVEFG